MIPADISRKVPGLRKKLLKWYSKHARSYPWRETDDAFRVLMAELMLRRTRADQVKPVYEAFVETFPDVDALDRANEADVARAVYSIGLNWRVPAFKKVARKLKEKHSGYVPDTREELLELEGVGEYVAGAVLSIAFGKREWIVDSNVARVFKRYFGLETIKEARRDKQVVTLSYAYVDCPEPRDANLALLDHSALICKSRNPLCLKCPISAECVFFADLKKRIVKKPVNRENKVR